MGDAALVVDLALAFAVAESRAAEEVEVEVEVETEADEEADAPAGAVDARDTMRRGRGEEAVSGPSPMDGSDSGEDIGASRSC